jgi:hypothetical protein
VWVREREAGGEGGGERELASEQEKERNAVEKGGKEGERRRKTDGRRVGGRQGESQTHTHT